MRHFIWKLFFVTAIALSLGFNPPVSADEVTGYIDGIDIGDSKIEIIDGGGVLYVIQGFPFNNLDAQLEEVFGEDSSIKLDDCLTVQYSEKTMPVAGETFYKWDSLTMYINESNRCEDCAIVGGIEFECDCDAIGDCDEDGMTIEPFITRNRARPGEGQQGHGQGQVHGKPPVTVPGHNKR